MKKVLNFQPATTTFFGIFRMLTTQFLVISCLLLFLTSTTLSAQSNQQRDRVPDILTETAVFPNPVIAGEAVRITQVPPNAVIEIVTIDGINLVKFRPNPEETTEITWDLTTPNGDTVSPGVYFVFVSMEGIGNRVFKLSVLE